jgi:uncharacterized protein YeaO (DUF488 family)
VTTRLLTGHYGGYRPGMGVAVRTSVGTPKWWQSALEHVREVTPYGIFGHTDEWSEYRRLYVARLDRIDTTVLLRRFNDISARHGGRPLVLLCFERDRRRCHRSLLADWLEAHGFGPVPEARLSGETPAQMTLDSGSAL